MVTGRFLLVVASISESAPLSVRLSFIQVHSRVHGERTDVGNDSSAMFVSFGNDLTERVDNE